MAELDDWRVNIESLRLSGDVVQGWGILEGQGDWPVSVRLEMMGSDGRFIRSIPVTVGASLSPGQRPINIYGTFDSQAGACELVLEWQDSASRRLAVPCPRDVTGKRGAARLFALPWRHYLARAWNLARSGRFRPLLDKGWRLCRMALLPGHKPGALVEWLASRGRPLALVIDHDLGGGANHYRRGLVERLLQRGRAPLLVTIHHGLLSYQLTGMKGRSVRHAYPDDLDELFQAFSGQSVDAVYFNNILSFPAPLEAVAKLASWLGDAVPGPRFTFLVHDHYCICPSWLLLNAEGRFCDVPDETTCNRCLPRASAPFIELAGTRDIHTWRAAWFPLLERADEIRCFSAASRRLITKAYPMLGTENVTVVPHRPDLQGLRPLKLQDHGRPVVGVIGHLTHHKGSDVVVELADFIRSTASPARIVVVGTIDREVPPQVVTVTGPYRREELPEILERHGVNIGFLPSICPETFSYVTEEMLQMELPVLVFDLGAPGERVAAYDRGLVISYDGPSRVLEAIQELYHRHVRGILQGASR